MQDFKKYVLTSSSEFHCFMNFIFLVLCFHLLTSYISIYIISHIQV